jgi:hypothetical protein
MAAVAAASTKKAHAASSRSPKGAKVSRKPPIAAVATATGLETEATAPPGQEPVEPVDVVEATSWEVSDDAPLASMSAAYAATKAAVAEPTAARTFDEPPAKGVERATIRSRLVRFNAEPDDLLSVELGRLDRGDEVEIVGSFEGFLNVRVPDGTTGWIHRAAIV